MSICVLDGLIHHLSVMIEKKKNILGLRKRVAFEIHLEPMSRFQRLFGRWVDGSFDMRVLCLVDCGLHIKIAFPIFLLSDSHP